MKLLGDWNWYLPERVRRALRLRRSGARRAPVAAQLTVARPMHSVGADDR